MAQIYDASAPPDNGLTIARLATIYDRTAAFYDSVVAAQQAPAKLAAIEALARHAGERLLEVGLGTAWAFRRVVDATGVEGAIGVDVAAGMLVVARERLAAESGLVHAPFALADVTALPFASGVFDCLLLSYTLEVLPNADMLPALSECRRVLRRDGRIVVLNLTPGENGGAALTAEWQRRFASDPEAYGGARPLRAQGLLARAGFERVRRRYVGPDWPSEVITGVRGKS
jgi:ubiquinone/menaquinone biosynthesis C-methylase UbiE